MTEWLKQSISRAITKEPQDVDRLQVTFVGP